MSREYEVELHFFDGKTVTAVFPGESTDEALKMAFGGKLNGTHISAKLANSEDKIGYSVSALAFATVTEWCEARRTLRVVCGHSCGSKRYYERR